MTYIMYTHTLYISQCFWSLKRKHVSKPGAVGIHQLAVQKVGLRTSLVELEKKLAASKRIRDLLETVGLFTSKSPTSSMGIPLKPMIIF